MLGKTLALAHHLALCLIESVDINAGPDLMPRRAAPAPATLARTEGRRSISTLLELLDSRVRPGVKADEFRRLFVRCDCGYIVTRRAYRNHACAGESMEPAKNDVIDLTGDD
jgi:hypothetical protein